MGEVKSSSSKPESLPVVRAAPPAKQLKTSTQHQLGSTTQRSMHCLLAYLAQALQHYAVYINNFNGSALTLLVGRQKGHPTCKKTEWWGVGVVICLERGASLHMAQLMPLPLTVSCFSKIQIGFYLSGTGSPG